MGAIQGRQSMTFGVKLSSVSSDHLSGIALLFLGLHMSTVEKVGKDPHSMIANMMDMVLW